jgi:hypothetical protein
MLGAELDSTPPGEPIQLSALEFDVLWEYLRLGEPPLVLKVPSPGQTFTERRAMVAEVWQGLELRGLGRSVDLDPRLTHLLGLLAAPDREIDGRFSVSRGARLLVAAAGEQAVFAVLSKHGLTLEPVAPTALARQAVSVLRPKPAGPGESVTVRSTDLDAAAAEATSPEQFEAALRRRRVRPRDAELLRVMVTQVRGQGQFGAAARDRWGHRRRAPRVIGYFDTAAGRYLQTRVVAPDGVAWSTVSPADDRLLAGELSDLLATVVEG